MEYFGGNNKTKGGSCYPVVRRSTDDCRHVATHIWGAMKFSEQQTINFGSTYLCYYTVQYRKMMAVKVMFGAKATIF